MDFDKAIEDVAARYRSEGYQVTVRPKNSQVPSFAASFHLDLLGVKGGEHVLVQIKETTEDLRKDPESVRFAEIVNAQPGWRFDLFVLNPDSSAEKLPKEAPEPSVDTILVNLDHAEQSARAGDHASSFVLAWASLEATMRRAAREAGIEVHSLSPVFLLGTLYSNGILERSEFDQLKEYLRYRNAVVHGLGAPSVDGAAPLYVASTARKLLAQAGQEQSSK